MCDITFGVITVSDTCSRSEAVDLSGPHLQRLIDDKFGVKNIRYKLIPDEVDQIEASLLQFSDEENLNVIFTSGGTGFAPRDVTPEATKRVIQKDAPQLALLMGLKSLEKTKFAVLSRAVCGIRENSLIINLPGSKKAVEECFLSICEVIPHAVDVITDKTKCVRETHKGVQNGAKGQNGAKESNGVAKKKPPHICPHETGDGQSDRVSSYPMVGTDQALQTIFSLCDKYRGKPAEVTSFLNLPPFRASIKDGYAVKSSGGAGIKLVKGYINAGDPTVGLSFAENECFKINTGAPLPSEADAIIQIEDTELVESYEDGREKEIKLLRGPEEGEDIREIGSDIRNGEHLFWNENPLGPGEVALAASCGQSIDELPKVRVAIISTGDELVQPGASLLDGQIYDSNTIMLKKLLEQFGFEQVDTFVAADGHDGLKGVVEQAMRTCQLIVCTGGVSMGNKDFVKPVLKDLGYEIVFGRVNMKPGKPMTFAHKMDANKLFFGLPGNPVSAFVTFHLFVLPVLRYISNWNRNRCHLPVLTVSLANDVLPLDPRPEYMRASISSVNGKLWASVTGDQISSRLKSLVNADVLLQMPQMSESCSSLRRGAQVKAIVLKHDFISEVR